MARSIVLLVSLGWLVLQFTGSQAQIQPPPRPSNLGGPAPQTTASVNPSADQIERWYHDPRWAGIAGSGSLGLISLFLQWFYRWHDKRRAKAEAEFDEDIGAPLRECFAALRNLASATRSLANFSDDSEMQDALKKILHETAPSALSPYASAASFADRRLSISIFSAAGVELEDIVYDELDRIKQTKDQKIIGISARKIAAAIDSLIFKVSDNLRRCRTHFICSP